MKNFRFVLKTLGMMLLLSNPCSHSAADETLTPLSPAAQAYLDHVDFSFIKTALQRKDNDLGYFDQKSGERVQIPEVVRQAMRTTAKKDLEAVLHIIAYDDQHEKRSFDPKEVQNLHEVFKTVFRLNMPNHFQLYALFADFYGSLGGPDYYLFLYDPRSDKVTQEPAVLSAHWVGDTPKYSPLVPPYVSFEDIYGDGRFEIVLQEFFHNGTDSNAAIYEFYNVEKDLSLEDVLDIKNRFTTRWHVDGPKVETPTQESDEMTGEYHMATISREWSPDGPNQIRVETFAQENDTKTDVGTSYLKAEKPGGVFKLVGKKVQSRQFEGWLEAFPWDPQKEY